MMVAELFKVRFVSTINICDHIITVSGRLAAVILFPLHGNYYYYRLTQERFCFSLSHTPTHSQKPFKPIVTPQKP
jgi:hypothetical protein